MLGRRVLPNPGPPSLQPMVGEIGSAARGEVWVPFSTSCHAFSCSWVASFLAGRGLQLLLGLEAGEAVGVSTGGAFGEADRERGRGRGRGRLRQSLSVKKPLVAQGRLKTADEPLCYGALAEFLEKNRTLSSYS